MPVSIFIITRLWPVVKKKLPAEVELTSAGGFYFRFSDDPSPSMLQTEAERRDASSSSWVTAMRVRPPRWRRAEAAEQKARVTYDNILRLVDDPDVKDPIRYLRQRELVHFQRFGDALRIAQDRMNEKNFYACNPSFDKGCGKMKNC